MEDGIFLEMRGANLHYPIPEITTPIGEIGDFMYILVSLFSLHHCCLHSV